MKKGANVCVRCKQEFGKWHGLGGFEVASVPKSYEGIVDAIELPLCPLCQRPYCSACMPIHTCLLLRYKMVVVVRKDLNMSPGKVAAQVAHAPVELINNFHKQGINLAGYPLREWYEEGGRMVVLGVDTEQEIERLEKACVSNKLNFHAYRDGGITEVHPNTLTVLGIGPDLDKNIDKVTEGLEAY